MYRIVLSSLMLTSILLSGCKENDQNHENLDFVYITKNEIITINQLAFDDDRFIDSCVFVPLETSDAGLIGKITQIETCGDQYYIFDEKMNKIKVFSSNGKFLFDIGKEGEGPDEYVAISAFFIDEKEKKIGIFDPLKLAVHEYSLTGEYLQTIKHNQKEQYVLNKPLCLDDYIFIVIILYLILIKRPILCCLKKIIQ